MSHSDFPVTPPPGYLNLIAAPRVMVGMMGMTLMPSEADGFVARSGLYDKRRRPSHEGHYYRVVESHPGSEYTAGQIVVSDITFRDHRYDVARDTREMTNESSIVGVLDLGDESTPMQFDAKGSWMLLQLDEMVSARVMGGADGLIAAPSSVLASGQRSSEHTEANPSQDLQPGIRVNCGRVVDAGPCAHYVEKGDVVMFQSVAGVVDVQIGGQAYKAILSTDGTRRGAMLGVIKAKHFPPWQEKERKPILDILGE